MPHQTHLRTFGRETAHRQSMLRNLTLSVLRYERVKTTEAKAKEVRRLVDRMVGLAKDGSLPARRRALGFLYEPVIVEKLFGDLATRYTDRSSGFTRTVRIGRRVGDAAPLMIIELMPGVDTAPPAEETKAEAKPRRRLALPGRRKKAEATEAKETVAAGAKKTSTATKKRGSTRKPAEGGTQG